MTTFKRLIALLAAFAMCFALCACGSSEDAPSDADDTNVTESEPSSESTDDTESDVSDVDLTLPLYEYASGLKNGDTAVTVNGVALPNELFLHWLSYDCYYMDYNYYMMGYYADFTDTNLVTYLLSDVSNAAAYYTVLRELCAEAGITVTDEQYVEYQDMIDSAVAESYGGDYDLFYQSYGLSEELLFYTYENSYLYNNYVLTLSEPTEADLEQYVADNGIFGVKHILLSTTSTDITDDEGNVTQTAEEYNAAQLALAEELLAQLRSAEDPETLFDILMTGYSEDSGLSSNPDGYTFSDSDSLVDGFREATLELEVGEISDVVETTYGYHIMLRLPVDASDYHDACLSSQLDSRLLEGMDAAEVVVADAISSLDVASFYSRYMAYGQALYTQMLADSAAEG